MEGTGALWFGVSLLRAGTLEKSGSGGGEVGTLWRGQMGWGWGDGKEPTLL